MKKLQKARTFVSVSVAGITGSTVALISDTIVAALPLTEGGTSQAVANNLGNSALLFVILVPALFISYFPFQWLATYAFNIERVRKKLLGQDYVEGYWLVDNSLDDHVVSTGFMHYQIIDEQLKIKGEHYSVIGDENQPRMIAHTESIAADCYNGKYYNHFDIPGVGKGVANGTFSSEGCGGSIPDSFRVRVTIETPPARLIKWGKIAPDCINKKENGGVSYLSDLSIDERNELIYSMAKNKVVTMHQKGVRISQEELDKAKKANPNNYKKVLAKKHYKELHMNVS